MKKKQAEKMIGILDGLKGKQGKEAETDIDTLKSLLGEYMDDEKSEPAHQDEDEAEIPAKDEKPAPKEEETEDEAEGETESKKEEEAKAIKARLAFLEAKETMRTEAVEIDHDLKESGLPMKVTKHLRPVLTGMKKDKRKATIESWKAGLTDLAGDMPSGFAAKGGEASVKNVYEKMVEGL